MSFTLQRLRTECALTLLEQPDGPHHRLPVRRGGGDDGPSMYVDRVTVRYLYDGCPDNGGWRVVAVSVNGVRVKVNGGRGATSAARIFRMKSFRFDDLPDWLRVLAVQHMPVGAPAVPLPDPLTV